MNARKLAAVAFAAALIATGAPAFAGQDAGIVRVRYADLDLSTATGARTLRHRIAMAMESACGSYAGTATSAGMSEADAITKCRAANAAAADQRVAAIVARAQLAAR